MRIKIAWLSAMIFYATLALVAANLDLGPIIKIAQCRSICRRRHMNDSTCGPVKLHETNNQITECDLCWDTCGMISFWKKHYFTTCSQPNYEDYKITACKFFETHGLEEEKYEPTKLPAPEENETIHMNDYDIAVLMKKNSSGIWKEENYYHAKQQFTMIPGGWIIIVKDDGTVKHYSWEKWWPKLQSLKTGGLLYQAYVTWQDWQTQLKNQREKITSNYFKTIFERWAMKEKLYKPSFVITWQQETGDGIMGNQVTDSESAQISLPCGKYLVRVATDNGPGSYPIIIDTGVCEIPKTSICKLTEYVSKPEVMMILIIMFLLFCSISLYLFQTHKEWIRTKNGKESRMEEGYLTEVEKRLMKKENLTKMEKKLMNKDVLRLFSDYSNTKTVTLLRVEEINTKSDVKAQEANASQNANANVIQKT